MTDQETIGVADLQCWVFRHAQTEWRLSPAECADIFERYDLFGFLAECYGLLHVSGYRHALDEVEAVLRGNGVRV